MEKAHVWKITLMINSFAVRVIQIQVYTQVQLICNNNTLGSYFRVKSQQWHPHPDQKKLQWNIG